MHKLSYKTLFIIFFFLLISIVVLARFVLPNNKVKAAWWNETWMYRQTISVTNSTGSGQTNSQVKIFSNYDLSALVTAGKLQSDLDDLRFTDINGNLIKYWIEDSTNNSVDIWGFIPSLPTSGTSIYMYYGNASATVGKSITGGIDLPGISCYAIKLSGASNNGAYYIDPTGQESSDKFQTYCDMTADGGGWTLMMKANGNSATFNYDANYWTTNNTLNPNSVDITNNIESKYNSFNILSITQIRATWPQISHKMLNTVSLSTPLNLFQTTLDLGPTMTQFNYASFPYQTGYQSYGFNLICSATKSVRWGWMFNNETTCDSNDVTTGIGLKTNFSTSHGGWVGCCESAGKVAGGYPFNVLIWGKESTVAVPINITFSGLSSEEFSPAPVGYWKFDEGSGTTAKDSSPNGINFNLVNATWKSENDCIAGKCLYFDGTTSYLDNGAFNFNVLKQGQESASWTLSVWAKPSGTQAGSEREILGRAGCHGGIYANPNDFRFAIKTDGCWTNAKEIVYTPPDMQSWYHLVAVYNNRAMSFYVNGKLVGTDTFSATMHSYGDGLYAGGISTMSFKGFIDEPKIFRYARTADQIKQEYNAGKSGVSSSKGTVTSFGGNNNTSNLSEGLVGYWKFDEGVGTSTLDSSGNINTGTIVGASWVNANYGAGLSLVSTNYISIGTSLINGNVWSVNTNIKYINQSKNFEFFIGRNTDLTSGKILLRHNGYISFHGSNGTYYDFSTPSTDIQNAYKNITFVSDGTKISLYIDGVFKSSVTPASTSFSVNCIGNAWNDTAWTTIGIFDELRLYNRVLSLSEVTQLYNYDSGPIGQWNLDEGIGTTSKDSSVKNNNATITNPVWAQGKIGRSLLFNGTNYATITDPGIRNTNNFTIGYWMKTSSNADIWSDSLSFGNNSFRFEISGVGNTDVTIYNAGVNASSITCSNCIVPNTWQYIAFTCNSSTWNMYVNGILKATGATSGTLIGDGNIYLGARFAGSSMWKGNIDQVKIYNYARTQKQILEDMGTGGPANKSPVGYWKFDEGSGTTAYNNGTQGLSLNGNFATGGSAPTWSNDSKSKKALSFNGSQFLSVPNNPALVINQEGFTYTAWIKANNFNDAFNMIMGRWLPYFNLSQTTGRLHLSMQAAGGQRSAYGNTNLNTNQWYHVAATYDRNGYIKVFLNGKLDGIGGPFLGPTDSGSNLYIGQWDASNVYRFNGLIDEVKVFNYALSEDEIKQDYNQSSSTNFGVSTQTIGATTTSLEYCIPGDTSLCNPPVGEWSLNEGTGTVVKDTSGNNNNGTWYGPSNHWTQGKIGQGGNFVSGGNYIAAGTGPSLNFGTGDFSVEFWLKYRGSTVINNTYGGLVSKDNGSATNPGFTSAISTYGSSGSNYGIIFSTTNGAWGTGNVEHTNAYNLNTWYHVVGVRKGTTFTIYQNGKYGTSRDVAGINVDVNNAFDLKISTTNWGTPDSVIDQVKVYNYARTPAQIAYSYNKGAPVGWWKFDECQGNTVYDWSDNKNNGTITIGGSGSQTSLGTCQIGTSAAWTNGTSGKFNSSLNFDGTDDYVLVGDPANGSLDFGTNSFSYGLWVYVPQSAGAYDMALYKGASSVGNPGYEFELGTGAWVANVADSDSNVGVSFGNEVLNQWVHLMAVVDKEKNLLKGYKNGVLVGSSSLTGIDSVSTGNSLYLGQNSYRFSGKLDDVRIYSYALTSEQVKNIYNNGAINFQ